MCYLHPWEKTKAERQALAGCQKTIGGSTSFSLRELSKQVGFKQQHLISKVMSALMAIYIRDVSQSSASDMSRGGLLKLLTLG